MRTRIFLLSSISLVAAIFAMPATPAVAQSKEAVAAIRSACPSDFRSLCSGVKTGGQEALACLQQNADRLSAACRTAVDAAAPAPAPVAAPAPPLPPVTATPPVTPAPPPAQPAKAPADAPPTEAQPPKPAGAPKQPAVPAEARAPAATKPAASHSQPVAAPVIITPPVTAPQPTLAAPTPAEQVVIARQCALDIQVHCTGISAGDGRLISCLNANEARLLPRCKLVVKNVTR